MVSRKEIMEEGYSWVDNYLDNIRVKLQLDSAYDVFDRCI
jgi:hypothetical protein